MALTAPELTIIMVSYNTRDLTLSAIRTCLETTVDTDFKLVVLDNASGDGSADAIAQAFGADPRVELIRSDENLGFARANNRVAEQVETDYLLLLNPDTECHEGAVDNLMSFARETPDAGIWGGRTVFPDGSLNAGSCANRITLWSVFCHCFYLDKLFGGSQLFNPEAIGGWPRDSERQVDIVVGCFLLIRTDLWRALGAFDLKYFMYGEEADLCLRAARDHGCRPRITPTAQIMHVEGAATSQRADKIIAVLKARTTLIRDHLPRWQIPLGLALVWFGNALRLVANYGPLRRGVWAKRKEWMQGF